MKTWSDTVLTFTARLSEHLGPVTAFIDGMADRLLRQPVTRASACGGMLCGHRCTATACGAGVITYYYYTVTNNCNYITCTEVNCGCA